MLGFGPIEELFVRISMMKVLHFLAVRAALYVIVYIFFFFVVVAHIRSFPKENKSATRI